MTNAEKGQDQKGILPTSDLIGNSLNQLEKEGVPREVAEAIVRSVAAIKPDGESEETGPNR